MEFVILCKPLSLSSLLNDFFKLKQDPGFNLDKIVYFLNGE